jgi:hypothetical protein
MVMKLTTKYRMQEPAKIGVNKDKSTIKYFDILTGDSSGKIWYKE